jgi:ADP-ribose pyrophosphatase YjhB (NUDIX family)
MTEALVVVSFLIQRGSKVLLVQEAEEEIRGRWCFPGGKLEQGETITKGAERELLEECGMKLISFGVIRIYEAIRNNILGIRIHLWANAEPIKDAKFSHDILNIGWFTHNEIEEMLKTKLIHPMVFHETEIKDFLDNKPHDGKVVILET